MLIKALDVIKTRILKSRTIFEFDDADCNTMEQEIVDFDSSLLTPGTVDDDIVFLSM